MHFHHNPRNAALEFEVGNRYMRFFTDESGDESGDEGGAGGGTDDKGEGEEKKTPPDSIPVGQYKRIKDERDTFKAQIDEYAAQVADLTAAKAGSEEQATKLAELTAALEQAKADGEASAKNYAIETALLKAGCKDTVATMAHIDPSKVTVKDGTVEGIDVKALATNYPYLFGTTTQSTGGAPSGAAAGDEDARMRKIMGLKPKE